MNLLFNVGLSVGNRTPVVRNAPLRERSFKHVLLTVLAIVKIPLLIEQSLVERYVLGCGNSAYSHTLINCGSDTVIDRSCKLVTYRKFCIGRVDSTGEVISFSTQRCHIVCHTRTGCRQEDGITIRTGELETCHSILLSPLFLAQREEFLEIIGSRQCGTPLKCTESQVGSRFISIGRSIVGRVDAIVASGQVTESEKATQSSLALGTHIEASPLHGESQVDKVIVEVEVIGRSSETLHLTIHNAATQIEVSRIIVLRFGHQPFMDE